MPVSLAVQFNPVRTALDRAANSLRYMEIQCRNRSEREDGNDGTFDPQERAIRLAMAWKADGYATGAFEIKEIVDLIDRLCFPEYASKEPPQCLS